MSTGWIPLLKIFKPILFAFTNWVFLGRLSGSGFRGVIAESTKPCTIPIMQGLEGIDRFNIAKVTVV